MKNVGTMSIGVKAPIIRRGDNLVPIVVDSVLNASYELNMSLVDKDIVAVTEAVVAKSQNNYVTLEQISQDVYEKAGKHEKTVGLIFPILSRNRFAHLLKGISKGVEQLVIQLSFPSDEVGNPLIDKKIVYEKNSYGLSFTEEEFRKQFEKVQHPFTGIDYVELYKNIAGPNCKIIFSNDPRFILNYTKTIICADIHTRNETKKILLDMGAQRVLTLANIMTDSINGSGYNPTYGLYGSNVATETSVKLFPRDCESFVNSLQTEFKKRTGKNIECMVYGDGAFKDPVGGIWELADPAVSPGYTSGLLGQPNELKFKYLADTEVGHLDKNTADKELKSMIRNKASGNKTTLGTTPRQITDLLGSLSDLTTGSGDKGTPIVLIKNYFSNYGDE